MGKVQGTDISSWVEKVDAGSRDHQEDAKKKKGKTQTQDARRKRNPNAYLWLFTSLFHISSGFIYGLHYTHTLTLLQSLTLFLLLPLSPIGLFFFYKIFTLTMTRLGRMAEARNILNKNEGIINHILLLLFFIIYFFGWFFTQFCFFFLKQVGTSPSSRDWRFF